MSPTSAAQMLARHSRDWGKVRKALRAMQKEAGLLAVPEEAFPPAWEDGSWAW